MVTSQDRPLKDYFCLADGRSAALLNSAGGCDFLCWPGFDSSPCLAALLDPRRSGSVTVAPAAGQIGAAVWHPASRVPTSAAANGMRLRCGLLDDGAQGSVLVWQVDGAASSTARIALTDPLASGGSGWTLAPGGQGWRSAA